MIDVVKEELQGNDERKKAGKTYHSMIALPTNHLKNNGETNTSKQLQCFSLSTPEVHIFRLTVDPGVKATCEDLISALQSHVLNTSSLLSLPSTIKVSGCTYNVSYTPPHGDELLFGDRLCDSQWIGPKCLGTAIISPAPAQHSPCDLFMEPHNYTRINKNTFSSLRKPQQ
ncbi:uncharacterized protein LOC128883640 isoform X2 [Hylaeus volcanicus]|uniref:uncharacterized protein LOC128883640 isoform X2 n=1 Tax=Hylaeus volcanicus TaxID=313075 RepID=UPI0023B7E0C4|nr:uncharacterized protein LOC128883640 isoform X2 [Hylaeus volcanicus]